MLDPVWSNVSDEAKDLINRMFVSSEERISAKDALQHPWIQGNVKNIMVKPSTDIFVKLKDFGTMKKLKKTAMTYIASRLDGKNV
jgi:hypothetical protein